MTPEAIREIRWRAPEFPFYEKGPLWSGIVIAVAAGVILVALWQQNFLFAIFAAVGGVLVVHWGSRAPEELGFTLSEKGLDIEGRSFYPRERLSGFAIVERPVELRHGASEGEAMDELILRTTRALDPYLKIPIPAARREEIRTLLIESLPEIEYRESLTEFFAKLLRF